MSERQSHKSTSKRLGIQTIINKNQDIFVFSNNQTKANSLQLSDQQQQLIEQRNDLASIKSDLRYGNVKFGLLDGGLQAIYPNQYTRSNNLPLINQWLLQKYCPHQQSNSNLILQLIHNNEDFKKILTLYLDMVFSMKVFQNQRYEDLLAKIRFNKNADDIAKAINKSKKLIETIQKRPYLFGFDKKDLASERQIFYHLHNLSMLRNYIAHDENANLQLHQVSQDTIAAELDAFIKQENINFTKKNGFNLELISQLYPDWSAEQVVKNYHDYHFNMLDKNLGLNLRQLALIIREDYQINHKLDDDRRAKFNIVLKFYLYNWLKADQRRLEGYIQQLRRAELTDKEAIYQTIARAVPTAEIERLIKLCQQLDFKAKITRFKHIKVTTIRERWDYKVLMIYSLTKFLTIKETNELISALLNKIEAITNLLEINQELDIRALQAVEPRQWFFASLPVIPKTSGKPKQIRKAPPVNAIRGLVEIQAQIQQAQAQTSESVADSTVAVSDQTINYQLIARQLAIINRIRSYHQPKHADYHRQELLDAISLFWGADELETTDGVFEEEIKIRVKGEDRPVPRSLKNILRNNVIKTKFFNYLVRYVEPKKVANLLHGNYNLALFLVQQLSPSQIEALMLEYMTLESQDQLINQTPRDQLTDIQKKRLEQYEHELATIFAEKNLFDLLRQSQADGRQISFIKPYLTCVYLLIKNLNRINAYYNIAFAMYERDYRLMRLSRGQSAKSVYFNTQLTETILSKNKKHRQVFANLDQLKSLDTDDYQAILSDQSQKGLKNLFKEYRDQVMHYNLVDYLLSAEFRFPDQFDYRNYFRIYQYLLQRRLLEMAQSGEITNFSNLLAGHQANLKRYQQYSKDLTYQLNLLFAYNYARYKDLSDELIFNRKY